MIYILYLDRRVFYFFNQVLACSPLDALAILVSSKGLAMVAAILAILYASIGRRWRLCAVLFVMALALGVADYTAFNIFKPLFARIRPCHIAPDIVRLVESCGGRYSFPSNHATNLAVVFFFMRHYFGWAVGRFALIAALIVGMSRIYMGVHYPLDVLVGFFYGFLVGWLCNEAVLWVSRRYIDGLQNLLEIGPEGKKQTRPV